MAVGTTNQWKLGLFIALTVGMGIASLFWLAQGRFRRDTFSAVAYFNESVQGLDVGSPMKFRGVPVGVVSDITIGPDRRHVQVAPTIPLAAAPEFHRDESFFRREIRRLIPWIRFSGRRRQKMGRIPSEGNCQQRNAPALPSIHKTSPSNSCFEMLSTVSLGENFSYPLEHVRRI